MKGLWSEPLADLRRLREREEATGTPLRTRMLAQPFWGTCSSTRTLGLASAIVESSSPPSSLSVLGAYLPTIELAPVPGLLGSAASHPRTQCRNTRGPEAGPGSQLSQGPTSPASTHSSQPCHNKRAHQARRAGTARAHSLGDPYEISYIRPLL